MLRQCSVAKELVLATTTSISEHRTRTTVDVDLDLHAHHEVLSETKGYS